MRNTSGTRVNLPAGCVVVVLALGCAFCSMMGVDIERMPRPSRLLDASHEYLRNVDIVDIQSRATYLSHSRAELELGKQQYFVESRDSCLPLRISSPELSESLKSVKGIWGWINLTARVRTDNADEAQLVSAKFNPIDRAKKGEWWGETLKSYTGLAPTDPFPDRSIVFPAVEVDLPSDLCNLNSVRNSHVHRDLSVEVELAIVFPQWTGGGSFRNTEERLALSRTIHVLPKEDVTVVRDTAAWKTHEDGFGRFSLALGVLQGAALLFFLIWMYIRKIKARSLGRTL